jgi:hypothetical protein
VGAPGKYHACNILVVSTLNVTTDIRALATAAQRSHIHQSKPAGGSSTSCGEAQRVWQPTLLHT